MSRWIGIIACVLLGAVLLLGGLLVPVHLRAVDASVVSYAGNKSTPLVEYSLTQIQAQHLGAAQLLFRAAQIKGLPDQEKLGRAVDELAARQPDLLLWGIPEPALAGLTKESPVLTNALPFTDFIVRSKPRQNALELLRNSPQPGVQGLLRCRALTHLAVFSPSQSASGQAFDGAIATCGLLMSRGYLSANLSNTIYTATAHATESGNSQALEEILLDLMSLGQRLNWGQLAALVQNVQTPETLRTLTNLSRRNNALPVLFAAVDISKEPDNVARYLMNFGETGISDLSSVLRYGAGGVQEFVRHDRRLIESRFRAGLARTAPLSGFARGTAELAQQKPTVALGLKWLLFLGSGFFFAVALHIARPRVTLLERPLQVRGFHIAREILFALGFLVVVLLLSEPFLSQESQKVEFPFRVRLPTVGSVAPAAVTGAHHSIMNQLSLLTLLLFFVLQGLIYVACLLKLAEIRRQKVYARLKLSLLKNEEHLFDAGLYLGFVGTIISLVLVSLGVIKPSLMAAYSSTSFGIIFVSIFKIFHLRPVRRQILLEAEADATIRTAPENETTLAAPL